MAGGRRNKTTTQKQTTRDTSNKQAPKKTVRSDGEDVIDSSVKDTYGPSSQGNKNSTKTGEKIPKSNPLNVDQTDDQDQQMQVDPPAGPTSSLQNKSADQENQPRKDNPNTNQNQNEEQQQQPRTVIASVTRYDAISTTYVPPYSTSNQAKFEKLLHKENTPFSFTTSRKVKNSGKEGEGDKEFLYSILVSFDNEHDRKEFLKNDWNIDFKKDEVITISFEKLEELKPKKTNEELLDRKQRTVQVFDIPYNTNKKQIKLAFSRYGEIEECSLRVKGNYQIAHIVFKDESSVSENFNYRWSARIGYDSVRVIPLTWTDVERQHRNEFVLKLTGLPKGRNSHDILTYVNQMGGKTFFRPRNPVTYRYYSYAYVSFNKADEMNKALNDKPTYKKQDLYWMGNKQQHCNACGSPDHIAKDCKNKFKRQKTGKNGRQLYKEIMERNKSRAKPSYANVVKKGNGRQNIKPTNTNNKTSTADQDKDDDQEYESISAQHYQKMLKLKNDIEQLFNRMMKRADNTESIIRTELEKLQQTKNSKASSQEQQENAAKNHKRARESTSSESDNGATVNTTSKLEELLLQSQQDAVRDRQQATGLLSSLKAFWDSSMNYEIPEIVQGGDDYEDNGDYEDYDE